MSRNKTRIYSLITIDDEGNEEFRMQSESAAHLEEKGETWVAGGFCKNFKVV